MQLLYEGINIAGDVEIRKADLIDNAGGELDSLELEINDTQGLWSQWGPEKNNTIQVKKDGFDTGVMYVDEIGQRRGTIILKGLPIKQEAKTERFKAWENVRLLEMAQEIASRWGLSVQTYGITNQYYERVDQESTDFQFLAGRCLLEGYSLKTYNGKLIIFDQPYMEGLAPVKTVNVDETDRDFDFKNKSSGIYGACRIKYSGIDYTYTAGAGPTLLYTDLVVASIAEAQRFTKGLLRARNCLEKTLALTMLYDAGIAAGNTVTAAGFGLADGKYFVQQIVHRFVDGKTRLKLRGLLEGY